MIQFENTTIDKDDLFKIVVENNYFGLGEIIVVTDIDKQDNIADCGVRFYNQDYGLHTLDGRCESNHGYWTYSDNLRFVKYINNLELKLI